MESLYAVLSHVDHVLLMLLVLFAGILGYEISQDEQHNLSVVMDTAFMDSVVADRRTCEVGGALCLFGRFQHGGL